MDVRPLSSALGAEIVGFDVRNLTDDAFSEVREAFLRYQLLVFRDQSLPPEDHIAFSWRFGELETRPDRPFTLDGFPEVAVLSNRLVDGDPVGVINAGDFWHSDLSFSRFPCRTTFLYAMETAEEGGRYRMVEHVRRL